MLTIATNEFYSLCIFPEHFQRRRSRCQVNTKWNRKKNVSSRSNAHGTCNNFSVSNGVFCNNRTNAKPSTKWIKRGTSSFLCFALRKICLWLGNREKKCRKTETTDVCKFCDLTHSSNWSRLCIWNLAIAFLFSFFLRFAVQFIWFLSFSRKSPQIK